MNILSKLKSRVIKYWIECHSPMWQAKRVGLNFGENNQFFSVFWGSEPYLITIGDRCQITADVKIFTHGGGHSLRHNTPLEEDFDYKPSTSLRVGLRAFAEWYKSF